MLTRKPKKAQRKELVTGYRTWAEVRAAASVGVLPRFIELGGDEEFLAHLWEVSRQWEGLPASVSAAQQEKWIGAHSCAVALRDSLKKIRANDVAPDDEAEFNQAIAWADFLVDWSLRHKKIRPDVGRPSRITYRHFWCLALLPYLALVTKGRYKWPWLASWFSLFEPNGVTEGGLRGWWKSDVLKPAMTYYAHPQIKARRARSDRDPLFEPAFEYLNWREGRHVVWKGWIGRMQKRKRVLPDQERREYLRLIEGELPYLKALGLT